MVDTVPDRLLTEKDLAVWLGISLPTLQRLRAKATGPHFVQLSMRRVGYRRRDVEEWLTERRIKRIGELAGSRVSAG